MGEIMELKRFSKNKKQKQIIMGSIIGLTLIIGGISLYRSFAMYEEKQTFDVLKGTVPNFSTKDINLAFTIDGQTQTNTNFPNKSDGYIVEDVSCEDGVEATWNNSTWSLENIENNGEAKKVKCTVAFKKIDTSSGLNGAEPVLGEEMIPVVIKENGKVYKTSEDSEDWYDYEAKQWANAVILTEAAKNNEYADNAEISETDIESYFVWIPKFSYQLFDENMGKYATTSSLDSEKKNRAINIRFGVTNTSDSVKGECTTPMNEEGTQGLSGESWHCDVGEWMTHPAFLSFDVNGLWVGKFETGELGASSSGKTAQNSYSESYLEKIIIKPDSFAWSNSNVKTMFQLGYNYKPELQSHMMKNTEWGAVIYLTQSMYGRCDNTSCSEVMANNNSGYKTGYSGTLTAYTTQASVASSTTGNYSGIYDMSGGAMEQMVSVMLDSQNKNPMYSNSGFIASDLDTELKDKRFYETYLYNTSFAFWERRILGDATGELGPFSSTYRGTELFYYSAFFNDYANLLDPTYPWIQRGGSVSSENYSGIFACTRFNGANATGRSFRVVLAVK